MSIIERANLPQKRVSAAVVGKCEKAIVNALLSLEIELLFSEENLNIDPAIKSHADVSVLYLGGGKIVLDKSQIVLGEALKNRGFDVCFASKDISGEYPGDCRLNLALAGKRIFGRLDIADESIEKLKDMKRIDVRQGYAKCSVCIVNENALITDDISIFKAARREGMRALLCEKGDVALAGHSYGFIGGAAALIEKNHLLFFGDITRHRSYEKIHDFLKNESCRFSYLKDFPLTDIGGIVPIEEK